MNKVGKLTFLAIAGLLIGFYIMKKITVQEVSATDAHYFENAKSLNAYIKEQRGLKNLHIKNKIYDGLDIRNVSLKNIKFENVTFINSYFENVTFDGGDYLNVVFTQSDLSNSKFNNIKFHFIGYKSNTYLVDYNTFKQVNMDSTNFENCLFKQFKIHTLKGNLIKFTNCNFEFSYLRHINSSLTFNDSVALDSGGTFEIQHLSAHTFDISGGNIATVISGSKIDNINISRARIQLSLYSTTHKNLTANNADIYGLYVEGATDFQWLINSSKVDIMNFKKSTNSSVRMTDSPVNDMFITRDVHSIDFTFRESNINEIISEKSNYTLDFTDGTINAFDLKKTLINRFEGRHITFGKSIKGSELIVKSLHLSWPTFNPELQYNLEKSNVGFDKRRKLFLKQGKRVFKSKDGYVDFGLFEDKIFKAKTYQAKNSIEQFLAPKEPKEKKPLLAKLFKSRKEAVDVDEK